MLRLEKLRKKYDSIEALKGISLAVDKGEIYGLLGPNGAGKSTAINIISGVLSPTSGMVTVEGFNILTDPLQAKKKLGVVPQDPIVVGELSALQNCLFFGSLYGVPREKLRKRSFDLLSWIGLSDRAKEPVNQFSGGMTRRLSLILGILHEPSTLVLDEPTVGLDPQTRLKILEAIEEIASNGTAILFSTHYLEEAERLCHRIGIIDRGKILKEGALQSLREEVEDIQIIHLRGSFEKDPIREIVATIPNGKTLMEREEEMMVSFPSDSRSITSILERISSDQSVKEVTIRPPSLESLFISLTGRDIRD